MVLDEILIFLLLFTSKCNNHNQNCIVLCYYVYIYIIYSMSVLRLKGKAALGKLLV